jgi:hypothetical protein
VAKIPPVASPSAVLMVSTLKQRGYRGYRKIGHKTRPIIITVTYTNIKRMQMQEKTSLYIYIKQYDINIIYLYIIEMMGREIL